MDAWYDIHPWSKQYRKEVLQQARMRQTSSGCELPPQPATTKSIEGGMFSGASAMRARKRAVVAASLALGEDPTPCYEAYRTSGLTQEQMSFGEFRDRYADDVCAKGGRNDAGDARGGERLGRGDLT